MELAELVTTENGVTEKAKAWRGETRKTPWECSIGHGEDGAWQRAFQQLGRRKDLRETNAEKSELGKVLTVTDLTALGVGCTLGVGVYLLPGIVAKEVAGPAVVLSFLFAAVTSVFAGLCFAEFGARVPKAGSAYVYSYVTIGEFVAFTIGWNLIMEYIIGTASVARGLSEYIDKLTGNHMAQFFENIYIINNNSFLSAYFDLFAFGICIIVTITLAFGVKESMIINNLLTVVNVGVVIFVIIFGSIIADYHNWTIPKSQVPTGAGEGGFFSFLALWAPSEVLLLVFTVMWVLMSLLLQGEEVKDPQKSIPLSIIYSLLIVFLAYCGLSTVLTMMTPYYLLDTEAPIPYVFNEHQWYWAAWIVAIGGIFGLLASLFSGMFPLPRVIYAMANDGLLFKSLGKVHEKYKSPFIGTLVAGVITAVMAAMFQLKQLVDLMSIGTLLAYTIVAGCVLLLRYREPEDRIARRVSHEFVEHTHLISKTIKPNCSNVLMQFFNHKKLITPSPITSAVATFNIYVIAAASVVLTYLLVYHESDLLVVKSSTMAIIICLLILLTISLISTSLQPSNTEGLQFKVPCVPLIPVLSILMNVYLMMLMDGDTWMRFLVWMIIGYIIYFCYGIFNSCERRKEQKAGYDIIPSEEEHI